MATRIYRTTFSLTETSHNWNRGIGFLATLAIALAGFASTSYASSITIVPAGLVDGDTYRLVFVTADTYTATDSNIADYNAEVTAEADSVTALADLGTTWSVIGSTSTVSAIDNIGEDPDVPIYNLEGGEVADDATTNLDGLFNTSIDFPINSKIDYNEFGLIDSMTDNTVWTGTLTDGQSDVAYALGNGGNVMTGSFPANSYNWIDDGDPQNPSTPLYLYAISGVLTYESTPEPATTGTMLMGVAILYLAARRRYPKPASLSASR